MKVTEPMRFEIENPTHQV